MKTPFLRRRRGSFVPGSSVLIGGVVLFIGALFVLARFFFPDALLAVGTPFWGIGNAAASGLSGVEAIFGNSSELTRERDQLAAENAALTATNQALTAQVTDLTRLVGSRTASDHGILAGVLARPPVAPYDTLLIDAGADAGVANGAFVYGPGGVPLGTVDAVTRTGARVTLFSNGGRQNDGWVGDSRIPVTLIGKGGGAFGATLPRGSAAKVGDIVYLPGPGALPIGTLVRIDTNPSSPRDTLFIQPSANLFSLTWVEVAHP